MTLSFNEFATQLLNLGLPVKALDAASKAGFTKPPISLQAVISSAAPYGPVGSAVDDSNNTDPGPAVVFSWTDPANAPASGGTPPDRLRQATSWNLTVWEAPSLHPKSNVPVINVTVPFKNEAAGLVQYNYVGDQLDGQYIYQITAFNDFGSALTTKEVWITVPGVTPNISVSYLGESQWEVKGSGFTPGAEVSVQVWATGNGGWGGGGGAPADLQGKIQTTVNSFFPCSKAGQGQVQFWATDGATKAQSNTINKTCPSGATG